MKLYNLCVVYVNYNSTNFLETNIFTSYICRDFLQSEHGFSESMVLWYRG